MSRGPAAAQAWLSANTPRLTLNVVITRCCCVQVQQHHDQPGAAGRAGHQPGSAAAQAPMHAATQHILLV